MFKGIPLKKLNKHFLSGLGAGVIVAFALSLLLQLPPRGEKSDIVAEIQGETLTKKELRTRLSDQLAPIENDEYWLFQMGMREWLQDRLLEKEARAQGLTVEALYQKEVWPKAKVSYDQLIEFYNQNKEFYAGQSFEQVSPLLSRQLRQVEFAKVKEEYLVGLEKKHKATIHLKPPKSFVEGLAIPPFGLAPPGEGVASPGAAAPSAPGAGAPARFSEPGTAPSKGPRDAPITLTEFADFHCGFCKRLTPTLGQLMQNYAGKVRWVFRNYPLSKTPGVGSFLTHEAAACAQEQGKFWEYHDEIFSLPGTPQPSDLDAMAQKVGLKIPEFQACLKAGRYRDMILKDIQEGDNRGVQGTPTIFVNDQVVNGAFPYDHFANLVGGILDPTKAVAPRPAAQPSPGGKEHGGATLPAPKAAQFDDLKGRPSLGPEEAPITIVEFSDFYCPFCQRVQPTLDQLMQNYSGKIRRVWRHYPLAFHVGADRAHEASECAHKQGKFWPYHKKLFERQGTALNDESLIALAKETGLDQKKFEKCLQSGKYKEVIQQEIAAGNQAGVQGTPTFFINGKLISGALPYQSFEQIVQSELSNS